MSEIIDTKTGLTPTQLTVWSGAYRRGYMEKLKTLGPAEAQSTARRDDCVLAGWESADAAVEAMGEAK